MQKTELLEVLCFSSVPVFFSFRTKWCWESDILINFGFSWSSYPMLSMGAGVASFLEHKKPIRKGRGEATCSAPDADNVHALRTSVLRNYVLSLGGGCCCKIILSNKVNKAISIRRCVVTGVDFSKLLRPLSWKNRSATVFCKNSSWMRKAPNSRWCRAFLFPADMLISPIIAISPVRQLQARCSRWFSKLFIQSLITITQQIWRARILPKVGCFPISTSKSHIDFAQILLLKLHIGSGTTKRGATSTLVWADAAPAGGGGKAKKCLISAGHGHWTVNLWNVNIHWQVVRPEN